VSISASIALPLDLTGGGFATCVNWLAGSASLGRVGFGTDQGMLQCIASASSCDTAFGCAFIHPVDAGCTDGCLDGGAGIVRCIDGVALESPCEPPIWGDGGTCALDALKIPYCATTNNACSPALGTQCAGSTEYVCNLKTPNNYWSLACDVFGEVCAGNACDSPLSAPDASVCSAGDIGVSCTQNSRAIRYCYIEPRIHSTFDCSLSGRTCDLADGSIPFCRGCNDTCTPFDPGMGQCSGARAEKIPLCVDGVPTTFDCSLLGPGVTCVPDPNGGHCG
jgi:hypothetical protein